MPSDSFACLPSSLSLPAGTATLHRVLNCALPRAFETTDAGQFGPLVNPSPIMGSMVNFGTFTASNNEMAKRMKEEVVDQLEFLGVLVVAIASSDSDIQELKVDALDGMHHRYLESEAEVFNTLLTLVEDSYAVYTYAVKALQIMERNFAMCIVAFDMDRPIVKPTLPPMAEVAPAAELELHTAEFAFDMDRSIVKPTLPPMAEVAPAHGLPSAESMKSASSGGAGPDATGPEATEPDATGPDATGTDAKGPDATGPAAKGPDA
eukprot:gene13380-19227_t